MMTQLWEVAKTVIVASFRKNLLVASWLIMLPLGLAAWLFEISNPGFQSGFIADAGSCLMSVFSVILLLVMTLDHLFWPKEQSTTWFFLSRLKSRILLPAGKYLGISIILLFAQLNFAALLFFIIGLTTGHWLVLPFILAVMNWAEYSLLLSVLVLFSTFFSRLMSIGMMIPVFFMAHSMDYIKSMLPNAVGEVVSAFMPNLSLFASVIESNSYIAFTLAIIYSLFMSSFYIALAGCRLRSMDL